MKYEEIIEMAKEAGFATSWTEAAGEALEIFANLVAAKATEEANAKANASWTLMCKKMVAIEREACAKVCEERFEKHPDLSIASGEAGMCAHFIRARGEA